MAFGPILLALASAFPQRDPSSAAFPHYPGRDVVSLTGQWDFTYLDQDHYNASLPLDVGTVHFNMTQQVPGAWDARWATGLQYTRGAGVYRATLAIPTGRPAALHFEACSLFCRIIVDGVEIHNSTLGGFTPFWVRVPASSSPASRTLVVVASNVFDRVLTPSQTANYDFYQYGGLLREVALHVLPAAGTPSIQRVTVTPLAVSTAEPVPNGKVDVSITLRDPPAATAPGGSVRLGLCWDLPPNGSCTAASGAAAASPVDGVVFFSGLVVPGGKVWDPAATAPTLHTLTVVVVAPGAAAPVVDGCRVRFGLRIVSKKGRAIVVNGRPTKLHGYNRHEMYPQLGPSMPSGLYDTDLDLLQHTLDGNFIRGSHYPQDPRFLDRCDERGVLVWEEALAWGNRWQQMVEPTWMAAQVGTANAMLDRDTNHPAIILWGFFNEGETDRNQSRPAYATMAATFKDRDPSRLVTFADNRLNRSLCLEYADVVSFNFYPGWYNGPASGIGATWSGLAAWVASAHPDKPFIISETGAGGITGMHAKNLSRYSEEYQVVVDRGDATAAMANDDVAGISLWQFCDIKVDQLNTSSGRPGGINNKGVLSELRDPKLAAAAVTKVYKQHR